MKKLLLGILLVSAAYCMAQTEGLPIDTVDGRAVYRYEVQKSEGLYRISKNFGVSQEDLIKYNPSLQTEGLKLGQTIYIPVIEKMDSTQYITHVLQPKETLYGLSRQYGVTIESIQALNPESSKKMAIGSTLLIKKKEAEAAPAAQPATHPAIAAGKKGPERPEEMRNMHEQAVAVQAVEAIERPTAQPAEEQAPSPEEAEQTTEPAVQPVDTAQIDSTADAAISAIPLRLAYMLPFMTDATKRDASINRFVDFYEGSLIAIYEAQQQGQTFDIYTYDVQKSDVAIQQILQNGELQMVDAIIGPAYPAQVSYASLFAKQNKTPILIPFTSKVNGLEHNPYIMQFNPTAELEAAAMIRHLEAQKDSIHFVLVDNDVADASQSAKAIAKAAQEAGFSISKTSIRAIVSDSLEQSLVAGKENILVFNSDKYSAVQVLMSKVTRWCGVYKMTLFGHYSWEEERTALPMIYTSVFQTPNAALLANYQVLRTRYFNHEPASTHPRFDLLGYDITRSLISLLQNTQTVVKDVDRDRIAAEVMTGIQSSLSFERVDENGGLINSHIEVLRQ